MNRQAEFASAFNFTVFYNDFHLHSVVSLLLLSQRHFQWLWRAAFS